MSERACTKCGVVKPRTAEFFSPNRRNSDGLGAQCRPCRAAVLRDWVRRHPEAKARKPKHSPERLSSAAHIAMQRAHIRLYKYKHYGHGLTLSDVLGCTAEKFVAHIEARFQPGMTWDNRDLWHLDHIRPLASFDLSDEAQFRAAFHHSNVQPLWAEDNLAKGTSMAA